MALFLMIKGDVEMNLRMKQKLMGWIFLVPAVALIICLSLYPAIQALLISFKTGTGVNMHWNGFGNYVRIFEDKVFLQSIKNCNWLFNSSVVPNSLAAKTNALTGSFPSLITAYLSVVRLCSTIS